MKAFINAASECPACVTSALVRAWQLGMLLQPAPQASLLDLHCDITRMQPLALNSALVHKLR